MNDKFHLEINSFEDFIAFVAIIKGKEIDIQEIKKLQATLQGSRENLTKAIEESKKEK